MYIDEAYDTKHYRKVISDRYVHSEVPPRKNAKLQKDEKVGSLERNELLRKVEY